MKSLRPITLLFAFIIGITAFVLYQYFASLRENYNLRAEIKDKAALVASLEQKKESLGKELKEAQDNQSRLTQEKQALAESLQAGEKNIAQLNQTIQEQAKQVEEMGIVRADNDSLKKQNEEARAQLNQVTQERDSMQARFNSLTELKNAIRELKRRMRQAQAPVFGPQGAAVSEKGMVIEGNHGFMLKDGKLTYPTTVKIDVVPAQKKE